jgi:hypothetical protein
MAEDPIQWFLFLHGQLLLHGALVIHIVIHGGGASLAVSGLSGESPVESILYGILGFQGPARRLVALKEIFSRLAVQCRNLVQPLFVHEEEYLISLMGAGCCTV